MKAVFIDHQLPNRPHLRKYAMNSSNPICRSGKPCTTISAGGYVHHLSEKLREIAKHGRNRDKCDERAFSRSTFDFEP